MAEAASPRPVLDNEALVGVRPTAWILVGIYALFTLAYLALDPADRRIMVPATLVHALVCLGLLAAWRRWPPRPAAAHAWVFLLGCLALSNSALLLALTDDPKQTTNLFLLLIGAGFLMLRRPYFVAFAGAVLAVFGAAILLAPASVQWAHYAFAMVAASGLASVLHGVRRASTLRLDRARQKAEQSERHLRTVLTAAPLVLFATDGEGVFVLAEGKGLEGLGLRPQDLLGRKITEVFAHSSAIPAVRQALAGQPASATVEEGGRLFDVTYTPLPSGGIVGLATDVTDRRSAEQATQHAALQTAEADRLRELDRMRSAFVNIAAHELNTPLTPIQMQLALVDTPDPERREKAARILRRNVGRLARIVNDLVAVNRLQQGRLHLRPAPIDLAVVAQESVDSFRDSAASHGVRLALDAPAAVPAWGDPERLHQVVDNLLSNALKFTPAGGAIQVRVTAGADEAQVEVSDTGAGIAAADLPKLFQAFSQLEAGRQRGGTGLGLHLSQGIVQAHGGRIRVDSRGPGQGTTFTFTVPRAPQEDAATATPV
jgi:PAS domain S-box-containing protein